MRKLWVGGRRPSECLCSDDRRISGDAEDQETRAKRRNTSAGLSLRPCQAGSGLGCTSPDKHRPGLHYFLDIAYPFIHSFIHSFILTISIAPLKVIYSSKALSTTAQI